MTLTLQHRLQTQQQLSPRLQQSNQILQLAAPAFQHLIRSHLDQNPFLHEAEEETEEIHIQEGERFHSESYPSAPIREDLDPLLNIEQSEDLQAHLLKLLATARPDARQYSLCIFIVDALDENGYIRKPFTELLPDYIDEPVSATEWEEALKRVQSIAPTGVAARDLAECLRLQVNSNADALTSLYTPLLRLIDSGLELLAEGHYELLQKQLQIDESTLKACCTYLRQLDPKPGRQFSATNHQHLVPDVFIYKQNNEWHIVPNFYAFPKIKINKNYEQLLKDSKPSKDHPLHQEWQQAQWLVESVEKRHHTVCEVTRIILERQRLFFDYGDEAIRPLLISDIAAELNLHESTISRATSNKYMSTPNGVFSFRHFFSRDLSMSFGGSCSTRMVKAKIKQYIDEEPSHAPLSDVQLHQRLTREEINIAKRTVTKYRQQLAIPSSRERRQPTML
ncbi:RNA polymerase factor sigma-54 [Paenalcaligenes hominis]|uniref:RNA polymerase factor sigma-54 n=1 Tax=Paenalcaligenes hominis TaxID=643674 RepID=UPI003523AC85